MKTIVKCAATSILFAITSAPVNAQSKLLNFLEQVNQGLSTVTGLPVKTEPPSLTVRTADPKIPEQRVNEDDFSDDGMEIYFPKGKTPEAVGLFNAALPVIQHTVGVMICTRDKSEEQWQANTTLKRYEIEGGASKSVHISQHFPMSRLSYHDDNLCLTVKKISVNIPAANAIEITATYLATDSLEETRQLLLYQKNYRNVWQLARVENMR